MKKTLEYYGHIRPMTPRAYVRRAFPSAWFNARTRCIEGYSEGLVLGQGSVLARSIERAAWADAARRLRTPRKSLLRARLD